MSKSTIAKLEASANSASVTVTHNGASYTIARSEEWGVDVVKAWENSKLVTAVELLLGDQQYERFVKSYDGNPKMRDLNNLMSDIFKAFDTDEGE